MHVPPRCSQTVLRMLSTPTVYQISLVIHKLQAYPQERLFPLRNTGSHLMLAAQ